jgi:HD-like signal output (HDOD) protein
MRSILVLIALLATVAAIVYGLWQRRRRSPRLEEPADPARLPSPVAAAPRLPAPDGATATTPAAAGPAAAAPAAAAADEPVPDATIEATARVRRALHALAFDVPALAARPPPEEAATVNRILATLESALDEPRYMPRRPSVLPELMRAMADDETSRREIAGIVARDPSLAGETLRLANSAFYRLSSTPIESLDGAILRLGTNGLRALTAAALLQPVFRIPNVQARFQRFPLVAWDHAFVSGMAAETSAALVESEDPFAAQLLTLLEGLGGIVVFRVASDAFAAGGASGSPEAFATLIDRQAAPIARRIAASWGLSERILVALNDQSRLAAGAASLADLSPLGRCLARGSTLGALALLARDGRVTDDDARETSLALGVPRRLVARVWQRLKAG